MKQKSIIIKALMALLVIILGVNYNVKAQSDTPTIPKPDANGKIVTFTRDGKEV